MPQQGHADRPAAALGATKQHAVLGCGLFQARAASRTLHGSLFCVGTKKGDLNSPMDG
jgi:hypothetical protein